MTIYDWAEIKIEYELGRPLNAIHKSFGCNREAIRKHASSGGWTRPVMIDVNNITHAELYKLSPRYKFTVDEFRSLHRKYRNLKIQFRKSNNHKETPKQSKITSKKTWLIDLLQKFNCNVVM